MRIGVGIIIGVLLAVAPPVRAQATEPSCTAALALTLTPDPIRVRSVAVGALGTGGALVAWSTRERLSWQRLDSEGRLVGPAQDRALERLSVLAIVPVADDASLLFGRRRRNELMAARVDAEGALGPFVLVGGTAGVVVRVLDREPGRVLLAVLERGSTNRSEQAALIAVDGMRIVSDAWPVGEGSEMGAWVESIGGVISPTGAIVFRSETDLRHRTFAQTGPSTERRVPRVRSPFVASARVGHGYQMLASAGDRRGLLLSYDAAGAETARRRLARDEVPPAPFDRVVSSIRADRRGVRLLRRTLTGASVPGGLSLSSARVIRLGYELDESAMTADFEDAHLAVWAERAGRGRAHVVVRHVACTRGPVE